MVLTSPLTSLGKSTSPGPTPKRGFPIADCASGTIIYRLERQQKARDRQSAPDNLYEALGRSSEQSLPQEVTARNRRLEMAPSSRVGRVALSNSGLSTSHWFIELLVNYSASGMALGWTTNRHKGAMRLGPHKLLQSAGSNRFANESCREYHSG